MALLITGATGLVGSEILDLCKDENIFVHYLTSNKKKIQNNTGAKGFYWNIKTGEIDLKAFENVSSIIHLAGATIAKRWTPYYKKQVINSRVKTAELLYNTIKKHQIDIKHFIGASAIGIYPHSFTGLYTEEFKKPTNNFLYEVVDLWEKSSDQFSELGIKVSKLRIGLVLSNKGGALPKMTTPVKYYLGTAFGTSKQWQSWIHVKDLAAMFIYVYKNGLEGTFNAVAPNPIKQCKLIIASSQVLDRPLFLPNVPKFILKLTLGEMHQLLISSQRVSSKKIEEQGFEFIYGSITPALKNLLL